MLTQDRNFGNTHTRCIKQYLYHTCSVWTHPSLVLSKWHVFMPNTTRVTSKSLQAFHIFEMMNIIPLNFYALYVFTAFLDLCSIDVFWFILMPSSSHIIYGTKFRNTLQIHDGQEIMHNLFWKLYHFISNLHSFIKLTST